MCRSQHTRIVDEDNHQRHRKEHAMSTLAITRRNASAPSGRRTTLVAVLTTVAIAAIIVLAAALVSLSRAPGDGRVPHPEPAPAPIQPR
jgi:hypothetical protein